MQTFHEAEIVSNDEVGEAVRHLIIRPPVALSYDAGQFFILRSKDDKGEMVERSYSVANFDDSGLIEFVIRIDPHGHMSGLIDQLKAGQKIDIKGTFGRFGFASVKEPLTKLVLIAGGVGISPLRAMVQKSFRQQDSFPLQLFYGFRTPTDFLFREELEQLATDDRFTIIPSISEESDQAWDGHTGFVSDVLEGRIFTPELGVQCCICGPPPMVKATRAKLFELGFERSAVHVEAW